MWLKIAILVIVVYVIYIKFFARPKLKREQKQKRSSFWEKMKPKDESDETMVECVKCQTFVSSSEAFIKENRFYCSKECLEES